MIRKVFILVYILCLTWISHAQDFIGMKMSNYSGIYGIGLNPAFQVNGPKQIDINFLSLGLSYQSNYVYLEKSNILLAGLKMSKLRPNPAIKMDRSPIENPLYYNYYNRESEKATYHFYANAFVNLPSAAINVRNNSFALSFNDKVLGSINDISHDYGYYYYVDSATTEMWLDPMKLGLLHYGEVALTYATQLPTSGAVDINFGVTAKYLLPWDAIYLRNNKRKEAIKIDNGVKIPEGADVDFNWVSSYHYDYQNDKPVYKLTKNGDGVSVDLGATFVNSFSDENQVHQWKIGIALLDIGKVFIRNGESNRYITTDTVIYRDEFFSNVKDLDSFRAIANRYAFGGQEKHSVTGSTFSAWMPLALSIYGDFAIRNNFYLSFQTLFRAPMKAIGLERSNTIAISPRIEKPNFEVAFPIILHEFKYPKAGFYFRKGIFFAGSDNLTAWLIPQKLNGIDFYLGFRWSGEKSYKSTHKRNLRRLTLKCPVF